MALKKTFTETKAPFSGVLEIADAYWRVENITANKTEATCAVSINKKDGEITTQVASKKYSFTPDLNGANFIRQAYEHLKTLPEFANAQDC